jgi:antitoxin (DNA-binding transcriptional repressor) of toxin-antitoxin stability system
MTRITATEAQKRFSDILNRIRYHGERFEVARNGEVIAELVPAGRKRFTVDSETQPIRKIDGEPSIRTKASN